METELIIIFIASIGVIIGASRWRKGVLLLSKGKKTKAVVHENLYKRSSTDSGVYYPIVRFQTEEGKFITQKLDIGQYPAKAVGSELEIIYNPQDPTIVEINSSFRLEILPRILISVGLIGIIIGLLLCFDIIKLE